MVGLRRCLLLVTTLFFVFCQYATASAQLSQAQLKLLQENIHYFNIDSCGSTAPADSATTTSNASAKVDISGTAQKYGLQSAEVKKLGGEVIDAHHSTKPPKTPASVLKLIIADVFLHTSPDLNSRVTVKPREVYDPGGATGSLDVPKAGQSISLEDAFRQTLMNSSDTDANVLIDAVGGLNAANAAAHRLGYTDTVIGSYYNHLGVATIAKNETTVADLTDAMESVYGGSGDNYQLAQDALRHSNVNFGLGSEANKWGGTSDVTGNSAVFSIGGTKYIITMYVEKGYSSNSPSIKTIKDATDAIVGLLGNPDAPASGDTQNPVTCCPVDGSTAAAAGGNNTEVAFNFFLSKGLSSEDTAAIVGNFIVESGNDPINPTGENPSSHAYGIGQWLGGRLTGLESYATKHGGAKNDLVIQLNYTWDVDLPAQARGGFDALGAVKAASGIAAKATAWEAKFERSGGALVPQHINEARKVLAKYGSNTPGSQPTVSSGGSCGDTGGAGGSGQVVGDYSLPVSKKWYAQHKDWFTKPHHDYPAADIPVPTGTEVYSMSAGKIVSAPAGGSCGNGVVVDAGSGVQFIYCHGSDGGVVNKAKQGDTVQPGQLIMHVDNTGHTSGPHLHVGIRIGGADHCPQDLLVGIAEGTVPNIKSLSTTGCFY